MKNKTVVLLYLVGFSLISLVISSTFVGMAKAKRALSASASSKVDNLQYELSQNFLHAKSYLISSSDNSFNGEHARLKHFKAKKQSDRSVVGILDDVILDDEIVGRLNTRVLSDVRRKLGKHSGAFERIAEIVRSRGDQRSGKMAKLIALEKQLKRSQALDKEKVLEMIGHQKVFLMNSDESAVDRLDGVFKLLRQSKRNRVSETSIALLDSYRKTFNEVVSQNQEIGLHTNSGHYAQMSFWQQELLDSVKHLQAETELLNKQDAATTDNLFLYYCLALIPLVYLFSVLITNSLKSRFEIQLRAQDPVSPSIHKVHPKSA